MHPMLNDKKGGRPNAFVVYDPVEWNFHMPCMSRTQLVAFLLYLTVSLSQRSFESLFQHVKHCMTIFLSMTSAMRNFTANSNTHVCKFGWTKFDTHTVLISLFILLQVLFSSWCSEWKVQLYFPRDLSLNFRVAKNFFNNFFMTWAQKEFAYVICCRIQQKIHETHKICLWLERIRSWHKDLPICYTIQQKIHETHKIWHPSEQNYFVHFNKR